MIRVVFNDLYLIKVFLTVRSRFHFSQFQTARGKGTNQLLPTAHNLQVFSTRIEIVRDLNLLYESLLSYVMSWAENRL